MFFPTVFFTRVFFCAASRHKTIGDTDRFESEGCSSSNVYKFLIFERNESRIVDVSFRWAAIDSEQSFKKRMFSLMSSMLSASIYHIS